MDDKNNNGSGQVNSAIYEVLRLQLLAGKDLVEARDFARTIPGFSESEIDSTILALQNNLNRCYNFRDPATLVADDRVNFHRWYVGSTSDSKKWIALSEFLQSEGRTASELELIDRASTRVVSLLPAPGGEEYSGRGLVMGYVQSGKTTNFMSVAAKCADEGYRLIIVLSGVTNNLRDQTQSRLYTAFTSQQALDWHWLTGEKKDFTPTPNAANTLSTPQNRTIMVIKKNAGRLQKLLNWLETVPFEIRKTIPMLVIDDEADQASVNTAKGRARRTAINDRLLKLMNPNFMPKHAYVGYTATPFANMLIDPNEAKDLFPRDFIVSLPKGEGYFGAEQLFGRDAFDESDPGACEGSDIIRKISDDDRVKLGMAASVKGANSSELPQSLIDALNWFILATAARRFRSSQNDWSSMLIHASGRVAAHKEMAILVQSYLNHIRNLSPQAFHKIFENLWSIECDAAVEFRGQNYQPVYSELAESVHELAMKAKLIVDNNQSQDRLDYEMGDPEIPVVVVGGNTLARGLTLEGLISSYFLRTSNAYDSLLQMGRWFGYRRGYEDLQRIWMQNDLISWFSDLATVEAEIRDQIEQYSADEVTPLQVPILIRTHPSMQVTSAAKMYNAVPARVGLSKQRLETILFKTNDEDWLNHNLECGKTFIDTIIQSDINFEVGLGGTRVARNVPVEILKSFLENYKFFEDARRVNKDVILRYIDHVLSVGELEFWNVMLLTKANPDASEQLFDFGHSLSVAKLNRAAVKDDNEHKNIKALASPSDAARDVPLGLADDFKKVRGDSKSRATEFLNLRKKAGYAKFGLIGLYIVDKDSQPTIFRPDGTYNRAPLEAKQDLLGITFFFPESSLQDATVTYLAPPPVKTPEVIEIEEDDEEYLESADVLDAAEGQ